MRFDREFYSVAEVLKMAADAIAPIPSGKLTAFRSRDAWFPPGALEGEFCPIRFSDDAGWFPVGVVGGPFCPWMQLPGECIHWSPGTVEETRHKDIRTLVYVQACEMARAGEIQLTSAGVSIRDWNDRWTANDVERFILTAADVQKVFATFPISLEARVEHEGAMLKRAALIRTHAHQWLTIERDLRDAADNGLTAAAKAGERGMWWESAALAWAKSKGKLSSPAASLLQTARVHRIK